MTRDELMQIAEAAHGTTRGALVERAKVIDYLRTVAEQWEGASAHDGAEALRNAAACILTAEHIKS